ncbi:MAG: GPW/gp25 family protein [Minicystis sp.]
MAKSFLGTGWNFELGSDVEVGLRLEPDPAISGVNRVAEASDEAVVRQSIWIILSTALGERVARPDFGCRLHDLTFSTNGADLVGGAISAVEDALTRWERRINVLKVDAVPHPSEKNLLLIDIQYAIAATNSRFNLVYPFYVS